MDSSVKLTNFPILAEFLVEVWVPILLKVPPLEVILRDELLQLEEGVGDLELKLLLLIVLFLSTSGLRFIAFVTQITVGRSILFLFFVGGNVFLIQEEGSRVEASSHRID